MSLRFNILTLFPEMFPGSLGQSLAGKALERGDWSYEAINIRDFASGVNAGGMTQSLLFDSIELNGEVDETQFSIDSPND